MKYPYALVALTTNIALGNEIAAAIDPGDGSKTFGNPMGLSCRVAGSNGAATLWPADSLLTPGRHAVVQEFIAGGYPAPLIAAGFTTQRLDEIRAAFRHPVTGELMLVAGPRAEVENTMHARITAAGYEIIPRA